MGNQLLKKVIGEQREKIAKLEAEKENLERYKRGSEIVDKQIDCDLQRYRERISGLEAKIAEAQEIIEEFEAFDPSTAEWLDRLKKCLANEVSREES